VALHDYRCAACFHVERDVYRPITLRASEHPPLCPCCQADIGRDIPMDWIPQVGRMDASSGGTFKSFDIDIDTPHGPKSVTIDSLHKLRQVERETEIHARNGEGRPLRWRDYSHDRTNRDVHSFGPDPAQQAREDLAAQTASLGRPHTPKLSIEKSALLESVGLGPGVTESTASALPT
jgi:hypothetical protein